MKQGTVITKVIMILFLAAVLVYLGYSVVSAVYNPLSTITAVASTAGESYQATVWFVRQETSILSDYYITSLHLSNAAKVSAGGAVAHGYRSDGSFTLQQDLDEKADRLAQLEYAYQEGQAVQINEKTVADLDHRIDESIIAINCVQPGSGLEAAADQASSLRTLVLRRSSSEIDQSTLESNIAALRDEIDTLQQQISADSGAVTAPNAGWFAGICDGYEEVLTPFTLLQANVGSFNALITQSVQPNDRAIGRLVTSPLWYAAAVFPEDYAVKLQRAARIQMDLDSSLSDMITLDVETVSPAVDGQRLVIFSCNDRLQDIICLRSAEVGLVFQVYSGIRVPKAAVRLGEDGSAGVYVIEGANAAFKPVSILYDNGDYYLVAEDRSSTEQLWVGDEIIVSARNLFDGKVVK